MKNRELPKKGQRWKHFKGGLCEIIDVATHSETNEQMVVYKCSACITDTCNGIWARPLSMFMSAVETDKYPEATQEYRFEKEIDGVLFRGKRVNNGEWVEGDLIQLFGGRKYIIDNKFGACIDESGNFINTEYPFVNDVIPKTVGQYTGLKDKNGVEIYEGDIVKDEEGRIAYIVFLKQEMGYVMTYKKSDHRLGHRNRKSQYDIDYNLEIIGNIHENPELMEEKN